MWDPGGAVGSLPGCLARPGAICAARDLAEAGGQAEIGLGRLDVPAQSGWVRLKRATCPGPDPTS
jgi:hypothetical protein